MAVVFTSQILSKCSSFVHKESFVVFFQLSHMMYHILTTKVSKHYVIPVSLSLTPRRSAVRKGLRISSSNFFHCSGVDFRGKTMDVYSKNIELKLTESTFLFAIITDISASFVSTCLKNAPRCSCSVLIQSRSVLVSFSIDAKLI